jgi:hypothetical protein
LSREEKYVLKKYVALLFFVTCATASTSAQQTDLAAQVEHSHVVPLNPFNGEHRFEAVSGDVRKAGEIYVIRIHSEAGYIVMPHFHPEDEHIVVVKGSWALGMGERFSPEKLETMDVGTYGLVGKKMAHFARSRTAAILQVHGIGPFTTTWVTPMYEMTEKGVLLSKSASIPGTPTATFPAECFELKLGTRARGMLGEGRIIGAQCTPGQLTQYRVEKPDGERFWGLRGEISTP